MLPDRFWNGKESESTLNIRETDYNYEIELVTTNFEKKDFEVTIYDGCPNISMKKSTYNEVTATGKRTQLENMQQIGIDAQKREMPLEKCLNEIIFVSY